MSEAERDVTDALVKIEVACRLANEALPNLPEQAREALRDPVDELCRVAEHELHAAGSTPASRLLP